MVHSKVPPASPNITSVQVIASTSVRVSWSQLAGGGIPDNYQVVYERATGVRQQGDCPHYVHGRTVTTGGSVLTYTVDVCCLPYLIWLTQLGINIEICN